MIETECIVQNLISAGMLRAKYVEYRSTVRLQLTAKGGVEADPFPIQQ